MNADLYLENHRRGFATLMAHRNEDGTSAGLRALDPQALGAVYDQYAAEVYRYVRYRLNDDQVAEDIAGDVFLSLLEAIERGRGPETNTKAWLLSTASHLVTDHLRRT